jgi:aldehyde:ferredoxin oxidoreductase
MALIRKAGQRINKEITDLDDKQNQMRKVGTANIVEIMDHFDLLPTHNFRYGSHPDTHKIDSKVWKEAFTQGLPDGCWLGCTMSCSHGVDHFPLKTGPYAGHLRSGRWSRIRKRRRAGLEHRQLRPQKVLELNFYCDTYGVDTISFANCVAFAMECYEEGILNKEHHRRAGTQLWQRRRRAGTAAPDGARRRLRRDRRAGRALYEEILRRKIRRRPGFCTTSAWKSRAWKSPNT